ncbi:MULTISPECIES: phage holin family protein [Hyphomonas]|uniref:Uncharacterized protein n=2 Tax=Hyphomonas adhaerens TaxID=81029 RepID=A0A069E6W3_9PROT|nr:MULTISPECIES: hypothetical protein [Hyphomonas]KCZ85848.1 hypothetical protein HAD_09185 [Hyphomonas adhaerens MHS-3]MBB40154.1 hypothetical protein [Hyphomonas sp.]HAE26551.1 hypothetical protein [Hyphomonas adhaerens]
MDETKLRIFAAAVGAVLALGGVLALFVAITISLAQVMGLAAAAFTVAGVGLLLAAVCLFFCLQPFRSMEQEVDEVEEATADALADLPLDTLRSFVERKPLTTTAIAMALGYSVVRHPHTAQRHAERFIMSML